MRSVVWSRMDGHVWPGVPVLHLSRDERVQSQRANNANARARARAAASSKQQAAPATRAELPPATARLSYRSRCGAHVGALLNPAAIPRPALHLLAPPIILLPSPPPPASYPLQTHQLSSPSLLKAPALHLDSLHKQSPPTCYPSSQISSRKCLSLLFPIQQHQVRQWPREPDKSSFPLRAVPFTCLQ
jgi:hypothetical protein